MTIITKNLGEKKTDVMQEPLVENIVIQPNEEAIKSDVENGRYPIPPQTTRYIISARVRPYYSLMFILMLVLLVATSLLGIFGTEYLYERYKDIVGSEQQPGVYRAWGSISYDNPANAALENRIAATFEKSEEPDDSLSLEKPNQGIEEALAKIFSLRPVVDLSKDQEPAANKLQEKFEFNDSHEKIDLPVNNYRFVHDFYSNYTAIVDMENERCFIMTLDRKNVVPPRSLQDLFFKVTSRYYSMDVEKVRRDMKVAGEVPDTSTLGSYIKKECDNFNIFKLEKVVDGVVKRSVENSETFTYFDGKNIMEVVVRGIAEPIPKAVP